MAIEQKHLDQAMALAKTYGATRLLLFGSALSHPDQAHDLDLACDGVVGWQLYETTGWRTSSNASVTIIPFLCRRVRPGMLTCFVGFAHRRIPHFQRYSMSR
jgi:hypothetical protein